MFAENAKIQRIGHKLVSKFIIQPETLAKWTEQNTSEKQASEELFQTIISGNKQQCYELKQILIEDDQKDVAGLLPD